MTQSLTRLLRRRDFLHVARGEYRVAKGLVLQARAAPDFEHPLIRYGLTATKKTGNAVCRNRIRRRLRALAKDVLPKLGHPGYDYVLVGRGETLTRAYDALKQDLIYALGKVHRQIATSGEIVRSEPNE
jgi:ribonuclease P protein component